MTKSQNELTVLVQNIGFDKGFSGETNHPRGLVEFSTKPEMDIEFSVKEGLSLECRSDILVRQQESLGFCESESPYLTKLSTSFNVEFKENIVRSMFLSLENFPYERATIFLNGIKIGRYIKNNKNKALQEKFYLVSEILKPENTLEIVVWEKFSNIKTAWDFKNELKGVIMRLGDYTLHQLY